MQLSVCGAANSGVHWWTATATASETTEAAAEEDTAAEEACRRRVMSVRRNLFGTDPSSEEVLSAFHPKKALAKKSDDKENNQQQGGSGGGRKERGEELMWLEERVRGSQVELLKQCQKWGFDFEKDLPLTSGDYEWIQLPAGQTPSYYASPTTWTKTKATAIETKGTAARARLHPQPPQHVLLPVPVVPLRPTASSASSSSSPSPSRSPSSCMTKPSTSGGVVLQPSVTDVSDTHATATTDDILQNLSVTFETTPCGKGGGGGGGSGPKCRYSASAAAAFPSLSSARKNIRQTHLTDFFTVRKRPLDLDKLSAGSDDRSACMYSSYDTNDYGRSVKVVRL